MNTLMNKWITWISKQIVSKNEVIMKEIIKLSKLLKGNLRVFLNVRS